MLGCRMMSSWKPTLARIKNRRCIPWCDSRLETDLMKQLALALAALSMISGASLADAKACRSAHGRFIKCPPMKLMPKKVCRDAKGHFKKC